MELSRQFRSSFLAAALVFFGSLSTAISARIVDQIAAVLEDEVITLTDLNWFLQDRNVPVPDDFERRKTFLLEVLNQIIDQRLISREAEQTPFIQVAPEEIDAFIESRRRFESEQEFQQQLEQMGMSVHDFRETVYRRIAVNKFIQLRFEPFIIVLPDEIEEYYEQVYVPEREANNEPVPPLSLVEESLRRVISMQKTDRELDRWLLNARRKQRVEILLFREPTQSPNLPPELLGEIFLKAIPVPKDRR
jgi:hypothetical protein